MKKKEKTDRWTINGKCVPYNYRNRGNEKRLKTNEILLTIDSGWMN